MDVERTMQFILETQARTEAILQEVGESQKQAEARMDKYEARMDKSEVRMDKFEVQFQRRVAAINKLIEAGMKMIAQGQKETRELKAAQRQTQKSLDAFIRSMNRGGNGRSHRGGV